MKRIKTGLTGFILGDWLGMPYRGKGKGTFKGLSLNRELHTYKDTQM